MVFCSPVALASGAATAGATALGLSLDKRSNDLTKEVFLMQMRQTKRLFTAQWAEASYRYGESLAQAAQQHAQAQALAKMSYFQSEKVNSQAIKVARDQDSRAYEMTIRTEARESLRDELTNQFNRYNTIMLCNSVCLGCVYGFVVEGVPSDDTPDVVFTLYTFTMGGSIMCFSISLWFCVILVRRLHEHTASILERKLFAEDDALQQAWQYDLDNELPTGAHILHLVNQAYQKWLANYISPLGNVSIRVMILGVVLMFFVGSLLIHARHIYEIPNSSAAGIFWATALVATSVVVFSTLKEDSLERKKEYVYDKSYMDTPTTKGPMAKVKRAADELFTEKSIRLGSLERARQYRDRERTENQFVPDNQTLWEKAEALRNGHALRTQTRKQVLDALLTATEELDALPEDLIERLNKVIQDVDEADRATAQFVSMPYNKQQKHVEQVDGSEPNDLEAGRGGIGNDDVFLIDDTDLGGWPDPNNINTNDMLFQPRTPMPERPMDAQQTPVSLTSLRKKLGEVSLTSMIRLRNLTNEPLRLKSGIQLQAGKYIKDLDVSLVQTRHKNTSPQLPGRKVVYHLFPPAQIPGRTEVVIVARSAGPNWIPTSGIDGELVYVNKSESWSFQISFTNGIVSGDTSCNTKATEHHSPHPHAVTTGTDAISHISHNNDKQYSNNEDEDDVSPVLWQIFHETIDRKRNHEVLVQIDVVRAPPRIFQTRRQRDSLTSSSILPEGRLNPLIQQNAAEITNALASSSLLIHNDNSNEHAVLMNGILLEQQVMLNRRVMWQQRWCTLTPSTLTIASYAGGHPDWIVPMAEITKVRAISSSVSFAKHVFYVYSHGRKPIMLKAKSSSLREEWMDKLSEATGRSSTVVDWGSIQRIAPTSQSACELQNTSDCPTTATGDDNTFMRSVEFDDRTHQDKNDAMVLRATVKATCHGPDSLDNTTEEETTTWGIEKLDV